MTAANTYTRDDGIKIYSKIGLRVYDTLIMGAVTRHVWTCPAGAFVDFYRKHATANHADIGVGTGYCLDHCEWTAGQTRLALFDLQPNCLAYAADRLARYRPEQYVWDAGSPLSGIKPFNSIGLGGILHCLPGEMRDKGRVFDSLKSISTNGTNIFGYTLVNDCVPKHLRRRLVWRQFHRMQVINCERDSTAELERVLATRYVNYTVEQKGCFAFFNAIVSEH